MKVKVQKHIDVSQKHAIMDLWNSAYPKQLAYSEISEFECYLLNLRECQHYSIMDLSNQLCAWGCVFEREGVYWFALIVAPNFQGKGFGSNILSAMKQQYGVLNGWVIKDSNYLTLSGASYLSPFSFYLKNNFELIPNRVFDNGKIKAVHMVWKR